MGDKVLSARIWRAAVLPLLASAGAAWAQPEGVQPPAGDASDLPRVPVDAAAPATPAESGPPAEAHGSIEEVVVTAQKREENLQDVPIAISAFSGKDLESKGTVTTKDLGLITPGLQVTELAGYTFIYLRGVGSDAFIASADPSVATYVDGMYVPIGHGFAQELGGVERVEVLKGPQGTLFGRNSTGGAISVTTLKPSTDQTVSIAGSYANYDSYSIKAYLSEPILDSLAVSISGLYRGAESYYDRQGPDAASGIPADRIEGVRARLRWTPTDNLELLLTGQRILQQAPGSLVSANQRPSDLGTALLIQPTKPDFVTQVDSNPLNNSFQNSFYGTLTWQLPDFDIKLLGENLLNSARLQTDFDGSSQPLVSFYSPHEFTRIVTGELQLLSNANTPGADWLKWVGGVFFLKSDAGFDPVRLQIADSIVTLPTDQVVDLLPASIRSALGSVPGPDGADVIVRGLLATQSVSGYAQATADFTDWVSLTLGGRYQNEKRTLTKSTVGLQDIDGNDTTLISYAPESKTINNFSPKFTVDFHVIANTLLYASVARGFKSQTYNIINLYLPPDYVKPEQETSYEAGIKSTLLDHTLRVNAAVFQNDTKNLQSSFVSLLAGGAVNLENAGGARTRGAEADVLWLPLPELDEGLQITAGTAYLDAIYTSFKDADGFSPQTGAHVSNQDYTGNRVVRTPRWTGNLALSQTVQTGAGPVDFAVDGYYNSGFFFLPQNGEVSHEPSYVLLNAHAGILYEPWNLRLTAFVSNITDEHYNIAQFFTDFGRLDTHAPPRTYGLRLNWDF